MSATAHSSLGPCLALPNDTSATTKFNLGWPFLTPPPGVATSAMACYLPTLGGPWPHPLGHQGSVCYSPFSHGLAARIWRGGKHVSKPLTMAAHSTTHRRVCYRLALRDAHQGTNPGHRQSTHETVCHDSPMGCLTQLSTIMGLAAQHYPVYDIGNSKW